MGFRRRRWREVRPEEDKVRVNAAIRVPEVRVVNEDGQQLGVMATDAARDIAFRSGLDLVEIAPTAHPPVCKIMDYGRYKYEIKKKAASAKKTQHQSQVKEIKLRPRISDHDLDFKLKNARKFLLEGDKVKCSVTFRGREIVHSQTGRELLVRVTKTLGDVSQVEQEAMMEGRVLGLTLAPNRAAIDRIKAQERRAAAAAGSDEADAGDEAEEAAAEAEPAPAQEAQAGAQESEHAEG